MPGLLCPQVPQAYGGLDLDYRYNAVIGEELTYAGSTAGITLQSDIVVPYVIHYASEALKQAWLPKMVSGRAISAIAMTEPGAGSDLQGVQDHRPQGRRHYVINGSQDLHHQRPERRHLIIVVAKTDPEKGSKGTSLILVEADREGFAGAAATWTRSARTAPTRRSSSSTTSGCPMTNCWARRTRASST
jgi:acyl-CoA dehydrogenase